MGNLFCLHSRWSHFGHLIPLSSKVFLSSSLLFPPSPPTLLAGTPSLLSDSPVFISYFGNSGVVAAKSILEEPPQRPKKIQWEELGFELLLTYSSSPSSSYLFSFFFTLMLPRPHVGSSSRVTSPLPHATREAFRMVCEEREERRRQWLVGIGFMSWLYI